MSRYRGAFAGFLLTMVLLISITSILLFLAGYFRLDLAVEDRYARHLYLGHKYQHLGKIKMAEEQYMEAITINATRPDAHEKLVGLYLLFGYSGKVEREMEYLRAFPEAQSTFYFALANQYRSKGMLIEAIEYYQKSIGSFQSQGQKELAIRHLHLGYTFLWNGNYTESIQHCQEGLSVLQRDEPEVKDPRNIFGLLHACLSLAYEKSGQGEAAQIEKMLAKELDISALTNIQTNFAKRR